MKYQWRSLIILSKGSIFFLVGLFFLVLVSHTMETEHAASQEIVPSFLLLEESDFPEGFSLRYQGLWGWDINENTSAPGIRQSWQGEVNNKKVNLTCDICIFDSIASAQKAAEHPDLVVIFPSGSLTGGPIGDKCWSVKDERSAAIIFTKKHVAVYIHLTGVGKESLDPSLIPALEEIAQRIVIKIENNVVPKRKPYTTEDFIMEFEKNKKGK